MQKYPPQQGIIQERMEAGISVFETFDIKVTLEHFLKKNCTKEQFTGAIIQALFHFPTTDLFLAIKL